MSDEAAQARRINQPLYGIFAIEGALFIFSFQDAAVKLLSEDHSLWQIVCIRSIVASLLIFTYALIARGAGVSLRSRRPGLQLCRGVLMFMSYVFYYLGIIAMPIIDAAAIFYSTPLFAALLSVLLLGERVGLHRCLAVVIGFAGVVVMLRPGFEGVQIAALMPLLAALCYASCAIVTRRLGETDTSLSITFYTMVVFGLGSALGSALGGVLFAGSESSSFGSVLTRGWLMPEPAALALMAGLGLLAAVAHLGITHAYRVAPVSVVAPFEYSYLAWVALIGYLIWGEIPASHTLWGIALVVGGGLYVMWREARARKVDRA